MYDNPIAFKHGLWWMETNFVVVGAQQDIGQVRQTDLWDYILSKSQPLIALWVTWCGFEGNLHCGAHAWLKGAW
jgi:hypothetical protein